MVTTQIYYKGKFFLIQAPRSNHISKQIYHYKNFYEADLLEAIEESVAPGCVGIDVGAHIGNHSLFFSRFCKEVHAFEPNPETYRFLKMNCPNNVLTYNSALGKERGLGRIIMLDDNEEYNACVEPGKGDVLILSLDYWDLKPDFIKVDVEGYEVDVLAGGSDTISEHLPELFLECREDSDLKKVSEYVDRWGYRPIKSYAFTPVWHFTAKG